MNTFRVREKRTLTKTNRKTTAGRAKCRATKEMSGLHLKQKADVVFAQQLQQTGADRADTREA